MYKTSTSGIVRDDLPYTAQEGQGLIEMSMELSTDGSHVILTLSNWNTTPVRHTTIRLDADRATFMGATLRWIGEKVQS